MATLISFYETKILYRDFVNYTKPLSFDEWNMCHPDKKSAVLFVQFYNEIILAWTKANSYDFIDGEEGVSTVCQYLQKNVPIIEKNPSRFTCNYIYKVAYNCLYCICHDRKCDKDRWDNETSSIVMYDGKEINLFDYVPDWRGSAEETYYSIELERQFWQVVRELGESAEKVMRFMLSGNKSDLKKLNSRAKNYENDPLRDIDVSLEEAERIIAELKNRLLNLPANSACGEYILNYTQCEG